ncbi:MAG: HAD family phosphatase [Patescibacteria group bacterium]
MNTKNTRLAILDFDGTLIQGQSQKLLIAFFFRRKYMSLARYSALLGWFLLFKMNLFLSLKTVFNFATSCIKDKKVSEMEDAFDTFFASRCVPLIYKNSKELIDFLKKNNFHTILVSTAIYPITFRAKQYLGIDDVISTRLEVNNGIYTGKILGEPVFGEKKTHVVEEYIKTSGASKESLSVFADHYSDVNLFSIAKNPVAVNPSSELWKYAQAKKWSVLYLDNDESFQRFKSNIVL